MLFYGAAAQNYTGHNTQNLATSAIAGLGTQSTAQPDTTDFTLSTSTGTAKFKSINVYFDATNKLRVKISNPENAVLRVNGVEFDVVNGIYTTADILATEFDKPFTFELLENDVVVQTLTYSINAYAYSKWESETMSELAQALYRYGISAKAYAEAIA